MDALFACASDLAFDDLVASCRGLQRGRQYLIVEGRPFGKREPVRSFEPIPFDFDAIVEVGERFRSPDLGCICVVTQFAIGRPGAMRVYRS